MLIDVPCPRVGSSVCRRCGARLDRGGGNATGALLITGPRLPPVHQGSLYFSMCPSSSSSSANASMVLDPRISWRRRRRSPQSSWSEHDWALEHPGMSRRQSSVQCSPSMALTTSKRVIWSEGRASVTPPPRPLGESPDVNGKSDLPGIESDEAAVGPHRARHTPKGGVRDYQNRQPDNRNARPVPVVRLGRAPGLPLRWLGQVVGGPAAAGPEMYFHSSSTLSFARSRSARTMSPIDRTPSRLSASTMGI